MYCLVYAQSSLCTASLIFYTCVWLPLMQLKRTFLAVFVVLEFCPSSAPENHNCSLQLQATRFCDLHCHGEEDGEELVCSICLVEMEKEAAVSKLPRCGHVFHWECIDGWLDRGQFTCPLCRSFIFNVQSVKV